MFVAVTVAPGMAAPCWSVTVPVMEPYSACAETGGGATSAATSASATPAISV